MKYTNYLVAAGVEAYRTNDKKEVSYKDGIKQDDKNVILPKKHLK